LDKPLSDGTDPDGLPKGTTTEASPSTRRLSDWLDARTGYKDLLHHLLDEPIPGGARWRYVFGSALTATFLIQMVTGLLLMTSYTPSSSMAWGSVWYIQTQMALGWVIRGLHHFGSQAMIVLLALHLLQVLVAGAYRAPREVNWWFGMILLQLTLGFSLTGYLLPWDQKGYWATRVATNIMGGTPVLGPYLQRVLIGGPEYGNQTLTRFYGLHVGLLPTLLILCLAAHVALFRKHGVTTPPRATGMDHFWPKQVFMDTVASAAVLGVVLLLVLSEGGANLDAPADPSSATYPARPELQFLSLFQLLKRFPGKYEIVGTVVIPGAVMTVLLLLPLLDKALPRRFAHFLACCFVFALFGGVAYLTVEAIRDDRHDATFQEARQAADRARLRALELAAAPGEGIPPEGAPYLLTRDPLTRGYAVLESKCLNCHYYDGKGRVTEGGHGPTVMTPQEAADLKDFGTRAWVRGLLEDPESDTYFGKVPQCDGMATWKKTSKLTAAELDAVAVFVAQMAQTPEDQSPEEWLNDPRWKVAEHPGLEPFARECLTCHSVGEPGLLGEDPDAKIQDAPNLFAWGSPRWLHRMITKPGAPDLYGFLEGQGQMPGFADQLTPNDLGTVIRFLRNDYLGAPRAAVVPDKVATTGIPRLANGRNDRGHADASKAMLGQGHARPGPEDSSGSLSLRERAGVRAGPQAPETGPHPNPLPEGEGTGAR
jgi:quinol-cytochrome oxidoreductase complex cytochrome b subunit/mono/diheme cytochrome c family protein